MSAARINNRRAAGTNGSSVPDPPGAPALLGQSPPPHSSLPSPSFLRRCPWGGQRIAGLAVWGRDAGCGMRDAAVGAQRTEQPSSPSAELMLPPPSRFPPPDFPPPGWVPPVPPPWRRCRPSPQRSQALCPPVPRCWHAVSCPPPPHSAAPGAAPGPPPLPPQGQHPPGSGRAVPTLCHAAGSADGRRVGGGGHCPPRTPILAVPPLLPCGSASPQSRRCGADSDSSCTPPPPTPRCSPMGAEGGGQPPQRGFGLRLGRVPRPGEFGGGRSAV